MEIIDIQFAFNQHDIMKALIDRAPLIENIQPGQKIEAIKQKMGAAKLKKLEDKDIVLQKCLQERKDKAKENSLNVLKYIKSAFVTFNSDFGLKQFTKKNSDKDIKQVLSS